MTGRFFGIGRSPSRLFIFQKMRDDEKFVRTRPTDSSRTSTPGTSRQVSGWVRRGPAGPRKGFPSDPSNRSDPHGRCHPFTLCDHRFGIENPFRRKVHELQQRGECQSLRCQGPVLGRPAGAFDLPPRAGHESAVQKVLELDGRLLWVRKYVFAQVDLLRTAVVVEIHQCGDGPFALKDLDHTLPASGRILGLRAVDAHSTTVPYYNCSQQYL